MKSFLLLYIWVLFLEVVGSTSHGSTTVSKVSNHPHPPNFRFESTAVDQTPDQYWLSTSMSVTTSRPFWMDEPPEATLDNKKKTKEVEKDDDPGFSILARLDGDQCSAHFHPVLATLIWTVGILYSFLAIAVVCDDYFVASLEVISEVLKLSDDVAGATFMAIGSSAPELFTAVTGVFFVKDIEKDNPGPGTIVGSAVFNIAIIIGASVICAGTTLPLEWWPLLRDGLYYSWAVVCLFLVFAVITPNKADWWEGGIFVLFYIGYCLIMKYNERMYAWIQWKFQLEEGKRENLDSAKSPATIATLEEGFAPAAGSPQTGPSPNEAQSPNSIPLHNPMQFRRLSDEEMGPRDPTQPNESSDPKNAPLAATTTPEAPTKTQSKGIKGAILRFLAIVSKPILFVYGVTIPDCRKPKLRKFYPVTFVMAIVWIAIATYFSVEFTIKLGRCFSVSTNLMSLVVLAAGTSVPDAMSSIIVARQGKGNMAISNAIGSNTFDIFMGLGLPWFLNGFVRHFQPLPLSSEGLVWYIAMLFLVLIVFLVMVKMAKWDLKVSHGWFLVFVYLVFCGISVWIDKRGTH